MKELKNILQIFTGDENGGGEGGASASNGPDGANGSGGGVLSFDDFLKQEGNQAEFDRRINKAIQTAVSNAQKKWDLLTSDKVSEAERLAQMTAEQKAVYRADKAEKDLAELKRQISLQEMARTARKMLSEQRISMPDDIIMALVSEEAGKTKESVEAFAKSFKEAVQDGVKEALRGNPPKATQSDKQVTRDEILKIKDAETRRRLIAENSHLFIQN